MPTTIENEIEPCSVRFERAGSEDTPAATLGLGQMTQDSPERRRPALADTTFGVVAIGEGA